MYIYIYISIEYTCVYIYIYIGETSMFPMEHGPPSEGSFLQAEGREPLKKEMLLELREGSGLPENHSIRPLPNAQTMFNCWEPRLAFLLQTMCKAQ